MHLWVLCALLTASQVRAVCWRIPSSEPTCDPLMRLWLADASYWYLRNPDVLFQPEISCSDNGPLPLGARLIAPAARARGF